MNYRFLVLALAAPLALLAQSIKKETVSYSYIQPPLNHSADGQAFQTNVNVTYQELFCLLHLNTLTLIAYVNFFL